MIKTMSEVRKVAEAIGWSPETLAFAWQQAGIGIVPDPVRVVPWRAAYADWVKGREHEVIPEEEVWRAGADWFAAEACGYATVSGVRFQEFYLQIMGEGA